MRFLNFLVTAAILGGSFSTVQAKSLQKMTTPELIEVVREHSRVSKRLAAIDELVARRAGNTSSALANRCQEDPNEDVCARIVSGLAEMNHPEARAQLLVILRQVAAPDAQRNQALAELLISDKNLLREAMPSILMNYRSLPPAVGDPIIRALVPLSQKELVDIAIVITKDQDAARAHRIAALSVVEHFSPPRQWEAWIGMLSDPDSRVRAHCAEKLGQAGWPASKVNAALLRILRTDVEGNVRAAATRSLAFYANEALLPHLHNALENERHPVAWRAALDLLLPLADRSSVNSMVMMLERDRARRIKPEVLEIIIRKLAHIGDASIVPNVYAIEQNHQGTSFSEVCRRATAGLQSEDVEREMALARLKKDPEIPIQMWDTDEPDHSFPALQFRLAPNGRIQAAD